MAAIVGSNTAAFAHADFRWLTAYFLLLGAFYHLTSPMHPCRVTSPENETVDLICQYREGFVTSSHRGITHACAWQKVVWQRADYHLTTNITDTNKYGVWEAVPGWKMAKGMRISLLRIRRIQREDMGLYQCRIQCRAADGRMTVTHHMANICIEEGHPDYCK
ncbi:hypothetical protein LSH36_1599g00008 [Paralvinella palmiformis]|uniref:Ig-like domain-containing protein n=1 Tax=Paralvinella palmiformis TaxID=53620 RepID=A0AAD9ISH1_9ANNE|nr:hypothetical protein LSH36_1599g00008 [Paralvinella palmiformis]